MEKIKQLFENNNMEKAMVKNVNFNMHIAGLKLIRSLNTVFYNYFFE